MAQIFLLHWCLCNVGNHVPTGMLPAQPFVNKQCPQVMPLESDVLPARCRMHPSRPRWPQPQDATGPWRIRSFGVTTPSWHHAGSEKPFACAPPDLHKSIAEVGPICVQIRRRPNRAASTRPRCISISGLVVEYIVAIDVTRVRFPADAFSHLDRLRVAS